MNYYPGSPRNSSQMYADQSHFAGLRISARETEKLSQAVDDAHHHADVARMIEPTEANESLTSNLEDMQDMLKDPNLKIRRIEGKLYSYCSCQLPAPDEQWECNNCGRKIESGERCIVHNRVTCKECNHDGKSATN